MLIYDRAGKLVACTNDDALKPLGYESVKKFFSLHNDISEIFIQKAGYIASYDNLPWVLFLFHNILPQNKVLVQCGSNECEFLVKTTQLFSQDMNTIGVTFEKVVNNDIAAIAPTKEKTQIQPIKTKFKQYIDSKEHETSKENDLEKFSNEFRLEYEKSISFIYDFTANVKAKKELLSGDSAAIEAAKLKKIAENFRLFNIARTLETIENGEPNAPLLFSQIDKLQKKLMPYIKKHTKSPQNLSIAWDDAVKQKVEFDPNIAAENLGLPIELINEFVNDFIEQIKESKDLFDNAYKKNDIKTIKETAHKLKGAAINLCIEPIATKLRELQHNDDLDAMPKILIEFWGIYKGLIEAVR